MKLAMTFFVFESKQGVMVSLSNHVGKGLCALHHRHATELQSRSVQLPGLCAPCFDKLSMTPTLVISPSEFFEF